MKLIYQKRSLVEDLHKMHDRRLSAQSNCNFFERRKLSFEDEINRLRLELTDLQEEEQRALEKAREERHQIAPPLHLRDNL